MAQYELQAPPIREDGLQVDERRTFQRRFWTVERWAWIVFGLIIVAALVGVTGGGGYYEHKRIALPNADVDVPRVARWQTADDMSVKFTTGGQVHRLVLHRTFLDNFAIEQIQPRPERSYLTTDAQVMEFAAEGEPPHQAILHIRAVHPGIARYRLEVDGEQAEWSAIVLP
jgi:hypothetical protein